MRQQSPAHFLRWYQSRGASGEDRLGSSGVVFHRWREGRTGEVTEAGCRRQAPPLHTRREDYSHWKMGKKDEENTQGVWRDWAASLNEGGEPRTSPPPEQGQHVHRAVLGNRVAHSQGNWRVASSNPSSWDNCSLLKKVFSKSKGKITGCANRWYLYSNWNQRTRAEPIHMYKISWKWELKVGQSRDHSRI